MCIVETLLGLHSWSVPFKDWDKSFKDVYMPKCNCCVLLSKSIHVLMHILCWIYSHPLFGLYPRLVHIHMKKKLSSSESRRMALESSPFCLSLLGVFIESKLCSVTLGIMDSFYFRFRIRFDTNMWQLLWCLKIITLQRYYFKLSIFELKMCNTLTCLINYCIFIRK